MKIQLSDHFDYKKLLRFTFPSIVMMIFTSIYGVVDGFFISNFVGKTSFAAANFIFPFLMILGAVGFMFGTGGSAIISITMGAGDRDRANRLFSLFVYVSAVCGIVIAALGILFIRPVAALLGAEGTMLEDCVLYGRIILVSIPAFILQYEFQSFFVAAEKPQLGLAVTVAAGVTNMALDALFGGVLRSVRGGAALGAGWSRGCHGAQPGGRRGGAAVLFRPAQYQPAAAHRDEVRWRRSAQGLCQRFLGTDVQYLHVPGEHAL